MNAESGGSVPGEEGGDKNDAVGDLQSLDFDFVTSTENENIWCEQCKVLKQELQKLQQEHSLNYTTLKKKVISTDLLIKKYKAKCEDHDHQSKTIEDLTKKMEQVQRESSTLNTQLTSSLQQVEPLKKAKHELESELKQKVKEIQALQDKLTAAMTVRKQYESLAKSSTNEREKTEEEKKNNLKRLKELQTSLNKQEMLVSKLKDENKTLKIENAETMKKQRKLQQDLKLSVERMEKYWTILKEHDLLPKGDKRLRKTSYTDSEAPDLEEVEEVDDVSPPFVSCHARLENPGPHTERDRDSDEESLMWTFSPIVHVLSPLPPSPAPPRQCDSPVDKLSNSDGEECQANGSKSSQNTRKNFQKQKNQVKGKQDVLTVKYVEGRLLRRQSATITENDLRLSEEEDLDETLVPESKKLYSLKHNSNCSLGKEEDLVRTSDTAIHNSPEEEQRHEIVSPKKRRNSSRIISDSDSDTSENITGRKKSENLEQTSKKVGQDLVTKPGRYSLRRSPKCVDKMDMVPLGKRFTRSMSSPVKVSPKGDHSNRRLNSRLSSNSEIENLKTNELSKVSGVNHTLKGKSNTKLDIEKLKRDYKSLKSSHKIQNTVVENENNSHLFTRSKSKTILPTSGARGKKSVSTGEKPNASVDTKDGSSVTDSSIEKGRKEEDSSNCGEAKERGSPAERMDGQSYVMDDTAVESEVIQGKEKQNNDKQGMEKQNSERQGMEKQTSDNQITERKNSEENVIKKQTGYMEGTRGQNSDKNDMKKQDNNVTDIRDNTIGIKGKLDRDRITEQKNTQAEESTNVSLTEMCSRITTDPSVNHSDLLTVPDNGEAGGRSVVSRQSSTGFVLRSSVSIESVPDHTFTPPQSPGPKSKSTENCLGHIANKLSSEPLKGPTLELSAGASNEFSYNKETADKGRKTEVLGKCSKNDKLSASNREEKCGKVEESVCLVPREDSMESCDNFGADLIQTSASTDAELLLPVNIPFSSTSQSNSSQNPHLSVSSSTVISPEISEDGSTMSGCVPTAACPVSPLPPSPIDFIIPIALSPLPPSPIHEQDPLSPLPGSPWEGDSAPSALMEFSSLTNLPSSDNSSDNTPVVTPVPSFLCTKSDSPIPGTSGSTRCSLKEKTDDALCSFHAEAPSGALYVKPKAVLNKRRADLNEEQHSRPKIPKTADAKVSVGKRKSTDILLKQDKKLCTSKRTNQSDVQGSQGSKRSQEPPKISSLLLNVIEMLMEQYLNSTDMSPTKAAESLLAADKDLVMVLSNWTHWLVQYLLCSTMDTLALLKPVYDGSKKNITDQCPVLTDQEVKFLHLYFQLHQRNLVEDLKQQVLDSIWSSLSLSSMIPLTGSTALSRMYTGICRLDGDLESARVMVYQLLMSTSLPFHSLGVAIAGVWPLVLYKAKTDEHSMVSVIEQRITRTVTTGKPDDEKILECYYRLCNWSRVTSESHVLSKQILSAISLETRSVKPCPDRIFSLMSSLELLFLKEPMEFFLMHGGLNTVCQKCTSRRKMKARETPEQAFNPEYCKCIFKLLGKVLTKKKDVRIKNVNQSVKNLQKVLKSDVCMEVKLSAVDVLLELCVLSPSLTLNILHDWYDTHRSQVPQPLLQKISWTRETMLRKYPVLKCQPFS